MKAFEVWVNGQKKCVAGVSEDALLSMGLTWGRGKARLHVGGLESEVHLHWLEQSSVDVNIGDEVTIRIVEAEAVDEPRGRSRSRTRGEVESEVRGHLQAARDLLPPTDEASLAVYEKHLEQGHLIGAVDALGALGEADKVPALFWRRLSEACHSLTQYEDRNRYTQLYKAAKQLESERP